MGRARFRYNVSISIAGLLAFIGAIPVATVGFGHQDVPAWAYPLLLILLVPVAVAVWGWRAGTDADADGIRVHALFASRSIPWSDVTLLASHRRRVYAQLTGGRSIRLSAVGPADLPQLVAASGQPIDNPAVREDAGSDGDAGSPDGADTEPAGRQ